MMFELIGALIGGAFRLAPEVLKILDRKFEREHELKKLDVEVSIAKMQAEFALQQGHQRLQEHELDAIGEAFKQQAESDSKAWKWVASLSALVRPAVTYWFVFFYSVVKAAGLYLAFLQDGSWTSVLLSGWTDYDEGMLSLILTFWFVGRVWESKK
jgi:hypothetical protein